MNMLYVVCCMCFLYILHSFVHIVSFHYPTPPPLHIISYHDIISFHYSTPPPLYESKNEKLTSDDISNSNSDGGSNVACVRVRICVTVLFVCIASPCVCMCDHVGVCAFAGCIPSLPSPSLLNKSAQKNNPVPIGTLSFIMFLFAMDLWQLW